MAEAILKKRQCLFKSDKDIYEEELAVILTTLLFYLSVWYRFNSIIFSLHFTCFEKVGESMLRIL